MGVDAQAGWVALVGGGPGRGDLITLRGLRLLRRADVVVVDRLAPRELLDELRPDVEIVDAGKAPHGHNLTQDEINALIVERALRGLGVVRLKGGDPFVFGRGGEEALACTAAGVPCEVVPGVTSAVAVPAMAGIPVTHRGITQDVAIVSGHLDPSHPGSTADWDALATGPGTVVVLMGVAALPRISAELIKRGRSPQTPTAVIHAGGTEHERLVTGPLGEITRLALAADVSSPAVIVIGEVVALRDQLAVGRIPDRADDGPARDDGPGQVG
ncbi:MULTISPECIES: uroporphyrinogen-III C-methyltransferase [Parafrankia]|uniref:uroporphyrinogen-III C-methyltransferase n=1 Tax=Parafrankia soli TaxID=2599596 RepID=A0A1S1R597_9ACTN|nr:MULTISPECIES: uroporphyrinogen-III C-methyltransferase [Parafrankia]OHV40911.1 uroporphyrinogen-III C-methyltransferase [Parafrankia soli]TCJ34382.1 uroporphyrinogen-III C-methyltransferase [Parafrankia sp. BMG5.11]CAI7976022.1 S-adenosyl-L-methionine-dependent uroporphyrinogen III methyltransferase [Frankia sp. Hr75.2]